MQKTDPQVGSLNMGLGCALPCAHPVGSLRLSRRAILPSCRTRVQTEPFITGNAKGPVLRQALLRYLAVRETAWI